MSNPGIYGLTTSNRLLIADFLESLDDQQWQVESLCAGWTVHETAAHLLQPMLVGFGTFFVTALRFRGDTDRVVDHLARRLGRRSRTEVVAVLRSRAHEQVSPPRVGPMGPFAETCIHLRDIARPLGADVDVPVQHWEVLLDYLAGPSAAPTLVPRGRLDGLRLAATDTGWSSGSGLDVRGPVEALGMAATGRADALAQLAGPGVATLAERIRELWTGAGRETGTSFVPGRAAGMKLAPVSCLDGPPG